MNGRIAVTRAAGFIGRNVVEELNRRGHEDILLVDVLGADNKWKHLLGLRYEDLVSPAHFLDLIQSGRLEPVGRVIHLGASSATTECDADFLLENNYRYTRQLCEWCIRTGARFVYASSAATYGDGELGYSDDDAITPHLKPLNMYGVFEAHVRSLGAPT
ncbi:NAD-dependent epimerase/dehydratase family protein [Edaphobacter albus]|uniref:NAD-dependent epimerase/dehydratase family protein n=1 Tax=Edaphobacter sp. 4G125 TaxID=2763071 RepID=UPI002107B67D|nr:NAD-dependent epimerase/dehydratase family protein [Edaphobacter sp. 4G125]